MRIRLALALIMLTTVAGALDDADRSAARKTIEGQIEAFRLDDGDRAYSFAAPAIRQLFPTHDRFMDMVRNGYKPVYRPRSLTFAEAKDGTEGRIEQRVELQDADGVDWVALYTLEKDTDGSWKITGCALLKAPGQSV